MTSYELCISSLGWESPDPNRVLPTFARQRFRIHCITDGYGHLKTPEQELFLSKGYGFIIFPGTTPNYHPDRDRPWEYFWMSFSGKLAEKLIEASCITRQSPMFRFNCSSMEMRILLSNFCRAKLMQNTTEKELADYLCELFRQITPYQSGKKSKSQYFELCLKFIHEHYSENISIQDIANHVAIDRTYLYKLFKSELGISPQTYLIDQRIAQACKLLRATDLNVTEIALSVGFKDFSNFSRQFKKREGISPLKFRTQCSKENVFLSF